MDFDCKKLLSSYKNITLIRVEQINEKYNAFIKLAANKLFVGIRTATVNI